MRKRAFGLVMAAVVLFALLPAVGTTEAHAANEGDWEFTVDLSAKTATITKYTGKGGDIRIPGTLGGLTVIGFTGSTFAQYMAITSVTIPDFVTAIPDRAFMFCTSLTSVGIHNSIKSIGSFAFYGCTALASVSIPSSVSTIDDYAFAGCVSLTRITIPGSVYTIGLGAFSGCISLSSAIIQNGVRQIKDCAFGCCTSLSSIVLPESVNAYLDRYGSHSDPFWPVPRDPISNEWTNEFEEFNKRGNTSLSNLTILNRGLSPEKIFMSSSYYPNLTIHCYGNSKAHEYCLNNDFPFVLLPDNYVAPTAPLISVLLDGAPLAFDVPPQMINGRTMVPLRAIFEALGAEIKWVAGTQTVTATKDDTVIVLTIGSTSPTVNGKVVTIDQPGVVVDGRTLVPLRFVVEALGVKVDWDGATSTVKIAS